MIKPTPHNENSSTASRQVSLFSEISTTPTKTDPPDLSPPVSSPKHQQPPIQQNISNEQPSPAELAQQVIERMCRSRRWERQLLLGATDRELQLALGNCWCSGPQIECQFKVDNEPALRCKDSTFNLEVFTMSAEELASHIRRIAAIPQPKPDHQRKAALEAILAEQAKAQRREMLQYLRSILGEKTPRKSKQPTSKGLAEQVAELLFQNDCSTEKVERHTLIKITTLLVREAKQDTLKAAKNAVAIVESARGRWRSIETYWLNPLD